VPALFIGVLACVAAITPVLVAFRVRARWALPAGAAPGSLLVVAGFAALGTSWGRDAGGGDLPNAGALMILGGLGLIAWAVGLCATLPVAVLRGDFELRQPDEPQT
jgi:hypothetical protein